MNIANNWKDYKILDMSDGQKLEKWGDVILSRPDSSNNMEEKIIPRKMEKYKCNILQE